jgi:hypothetical protein
LQNRITLAPALLGTVFLLPNLQGACGQSLKNRSDVAYGNYISVTKPALSPRFKPAYGEVLDPRVFDNYGTIDATKNQTKPIGLEINKPQLFPKDLVPIC